MLNIVHIRRSLNFNGGKRNRIEISQMMTVSNGKATFRYVFHCVNEEDDRKIGFNEAASPLPRNGKKNTLWRKITSNRLPCCSTRKQQCFLRNPEPAEDFGNH